VRWFGHVEFKDDGDWVKHCTTMETEGSPEEDLVGLCQRVHEELRPVSRGCI